MKHVLILFAVMMVLVPTVYAEDDKWIDGIKFRYGRIYYGQALLIDFPSDNDKAIAASDQQINEANTTKFPIVITFPETLMTSWSFRGFYSEFIPQTKTLNIPPSQTPSYFMGGFSPDGSDGSGPIYYEILEADRLNKEFFYLRNIEEHRNYLLTNFLPKYLSDSEISSIPENWAMSFDQTFNTITLGYYIGVFIPLGDKHRIFKYTYGLGVGRSDKKIIINLCDSYTVTLNYNEENKLESPHEGKCNDSRELVNLSFVKVHYSLQTEITLWERISEDSILTLLTISAVTSSNKIYGLFPLHLGHNVKTLDNKVVSFESYTTSLEFISYTYRF